MTIIASNKYTVVLGLGISGVSAVRYLLTQGIRLVVCDTRVSPPNIEQFQKEYPDVHVELGVLNQELLCQAEEIIISPGFPRQNPVVQAAIAAGVSVVGDVELFARRVQVPVIAITGSNGKSTVTTLVGEMAKAAGINVVVAGNIGLPVLDTLHDDVQLYVLELSSFQLESTQSLKPIAATVLNVSPDHMDRYRNLMEYALTKQRIAFGAKTVIVNKEDALTEPPFAAGVKRVCFTRKQPDLNEFGCVDNNLAKGFRPLIALSELKISGLHNVANAAAAMALAEAANIPEEACLRALKSFAGLSHRCQFVADICGVRYINDSKATNVGATVAALEGLAGTAPHLHVILGGDGKGADFSALIPAIKEAVKSVAIIGKDGPEIAKLITAHLPSLDVSFAASMHEAVTQLQQRSTQGDVVLLSPACASLDMFNNFEHRGDVFSQCVRGLT